MIPNNIINKKNSIHDFWMLIRQIVAEKKICVSLILLCNFMWVAMSIFQSFIIKIVIDFLSVSTTNIAFDLLLNLTLYFITLAGIGGNYCLHHYIKNILFIPSIKQIIYVRTVKKIMRCTISELQDKMIGNITQKVTDLALGLQDALSLIEKILNPCMFILISIHSLNKVSSTYSWVICILAIIFIIYNLLSFNKNINSANIMWNKNSLISGWISDILFNLSSVRMGQGERHESLLLSERVDDSIKSEKQFNYKLLSLYGRFSVFYIFSHIVIIVLLFLDLKNKAITIGSFAFIVSISHKAFDTLWDFMAELVYFSQKCGKVEQALIDIVDLCEAGKTNNIESKKFSLLDNDDEMSEYDIRDQNQNSCTTTSTISNLGLDDISDTNHSCYDIKIANMNIKYPFSNFQLVVNQLNIPYGQNVLINGVSGSGKSTMVKTILGLVPLNEGGMIKIGEYSCEHECFLGHISAIYQGMPLFHRSIEDNMIYGNFNANRKKLEAIASITGAEKFISKLYNKYDSLIGNGGAKLSGGERQIILLSRILLNESAKIIILDESTANMDNYSEKTILKFLSTFAKNKTVIIVMHQIKHFDFIDRIITIDNGVIIDDRLTK